MINKSDFYHGAVILKLLKENEISIKKHLTNSTYIINGKLVFMKYSSNRVTPWTFTFNKEHLEQIENFYKEFKDIDFFLICHEDGVVLLKYNEFKRLISIYDGDTHKWIKAIRQKREKYSVTGSDGSLNYKVGENRIKEF